MKARSFDSSYSGNPHKGYPSGGAWFPQGMERTRNRGSLPDERQQPGNIENAARRYEAGRLLSAYMLRQQGKMDIAALRQEAETNAQGWKNSHANGEVADRTYYDASALHARLAQARETSAALQRQLDAEAWVTQLIHNQPQQQ